MLATLASLPFSWPANQQCTSMKFISQSKITQGQPCRSCRYQESKPVCDSYLRWLTQGEPEVGGADVAAGGGERSRPEGVPSAADGELPDFDGEEDMAEDDTADGDGFDVNADASPEALSAALTDGISGPSRERISKLLEEVCAIRAKSAGSNEKQDAEKRLRAIQARDKARKRYDEIQERVERLTKELEEAKDSLEQQRLAVDRLEALAAAGNVRDVDL